jgi:hypothetical protein
MKDFIKVSTALFVLIMLTKFQFTIGYEVVYAVNCGGEAQTGSNGIHFEADPGPSDNNDTQVANHGIAGGLPYYDSVIFQHQRCHYNPFSYPIPVLGDGKYVLILKFFEPKQPPANIEDHRHICVTVNGIKIIYDLDISNEFGCSIPAEMHRVLWVKDGRLFYTSRHFKKCMLKKLMSDSKEKNKLEILENWSIKKKQDCLQVFYRDHETKLFGVYFNHVSCIFILKIQ